MATKKKMLQAAAGSATGGAALDITDVFSTYLYDGTSRAHPIENGIKLGQSFGSGSARFDGVESDYLISSSAVTLSGDFTIEAWVWFEYYFTSQNQILGSDFVGTGGVNNQVYIQNADRYLGFYDGSSAFLSSSSVPNSAWSHIAITRSGSTCKFYINGNASGTFTSSASVQFQAIGSLTGNQFFEGYMNDVRIVDGSVVYTGNFTPPTTPLTAITNTALLVCQGSDPFVDNSTNGYTITNNGNVSATTFGPFDAAEAGKGGLVWVKSRSHATAHILDDTERGPNSFLSTNDTDASGGSSTVNSFNSNGFTVGSSGDINEGGGYTYASWTFRKAPKFFDVVTYTGTGSTQNISHDLGSVPGMIFAKRTDSTGSWVAYHRSLGNDKYLILNDTNASATGTVVWGSTTPTDSVFTVGASSGLNLSGATYVAYLFAHNNGDGEFGPDGDQDIIKCGSYTGNGSTNGPEIDLGFEPQWVIIKRTDGAANWRMYDTMRGWTVGNGEQELYPNLSAKDYAVTERFSPQSTGFKVTSDDPEFNNSGSTYIYIAIRRGPLAPPESATEVFGMDDYNGGGDGPVTGFVTDFALFKNRPESVVESFVAMSRLTGQKYLLPSDTSVEATLSNGTFDRMDGAGDTGVAGYNIWGWKRAPGFFDVVTYRGNSTAARTVSHNLGVAPEMVWVKFRDAAYDWNVFVNGQSNMGLLNSNNGFIYSQHITGTSDTNFTLSNDAQVNASNGNYIAYLFSSLDGISKVGSYTGDGTNGRVIDCGFSNGARFVLVKLTNYSGGWFLWDSERGIVSGNDPYLVLNSTNAEDNTMDEIDPHSSGFIVNSTGGLTNANGAHHIFYAIA